jgi:nucleotide-binding universal stress UspA family protein
MQSLQVSSRISLSNVLFTTDFSAVSRSALPYAVALARQYDAKLIVAHAVSPEPPTPVPMERLPLEADLVWQNDLEKINQFVEDDALKRTDCERLLERGDLWSVVSDVIERKAIDLVVVGTRGRRGFKRLVLGSDAEKIYRRARCPVLTIGPKANPLQGAEWKIKQILFPTDGSKDSLHALPYALSLAEENQAKLTLLRMIPLVPWQSQAVEEEAAQREMKALLPADAADWCDPEFVVRFEFPAEGVLTFAEIRKTDLIVMGVRHSTVAGAYSHLPWPIASEIVSLAPCPVLTVRG